MHTSEPTITPVIGTPLTACCIRGPRHLARDGCAALRAARQAGNDDEEEAEGDERERSPDVYWRREGDSRTVVEEPAPDEIETPFGEG